MRCSLGCRGAVMCTQIWGWAEYENQNWDGSRCSGRGYAAGVFLLANGRADGGAIGRRAEEPGCGARYGDGGRYKPHGIARKRASPGASTVRSRGSGRRAARDAHAATFAAERGAGNGASAVDGRAASKEFVEFSCVVDARTVWETVRASRCGCASGNGLAGLAWVPGPPSVERAD